MQTFAQCETEPVYSLFGLNCIQSGIEVVYIHTDMQTCVQEELKQHSYMQTCVLEELKLCSYMQTCVLEELKLRSYIQTCVQEELKQCSYIQTCVQEELNLSMWTEAVSLYMQTYFL